MPHHAQVGFEQSQYRVVLAVPEPDGDGERLRELEGLLRRESLGDLQQHVQQQLPSECEHAPESFVQEQSQLPPGQPGQELSPTSAPVRF